jgi:hypothetical protein
MSTKCAVCESVQKKYWYNVLHSKPSSTLSACSGVEVQLHSFLTSALGEIEWSTFTSRPLCPSTKRPLYSLNRILGQPRSLSGRLGEDRHILPLPSIGTQCLGLPTDSSVFYFDNTVCLFTVPTNWLCGHSLMCQWVWGKRVSSFSLYFMYFASLHYSISFNSFYLYFVAKNEGIRRCWLVFPAVASALSKVMHEYCMCSVVNYGNN